MAASTPFQKTEEEWRLILSPEQLRILRDKGTESVFYGPVAASNTMDQPPPNHIGEKPLTAPPPQPLHQSDADEDDENVKQLDECSSLYLLMQDCVVRSNRNWKECQTEIQALKECSEKRNKKKGN